MKRLLIFGLFFCLYSNLLGQKVNEEEARTFAEKWIKIKDPRGIISVSKEEKSEDNKNIQCYYIFRFQPKGYLIISGNKLMNPVLGYSLNDNIDMDLLPPPLKSFLEEYKNRLLNLDEIKKSIHPGWDLIEHAAKSSTLEIQPLIKTKWNQGYPYNSMCPGNAPAGCEAIAMAQLMNFYKYPKHGLKENSYFSSYYNKQLSANFKNTYYDWPSMTDVTTNVNPAISTIIFHSGISVNMNYTDISSSSLTPAALNALINNFGYDIKSKVVLFTSQDTIAWEKLLMDELNKGRPVIYEGSTDLNSGEAHSFILDGYDNDTLFHINWGWGGSADGYYRLDEIQFHYRQCAFFSVSPPEVRAEFEIDTLSGLAPLTVKFTDYSLCKTGTIASWNWDFNNDGVIDNETANPTFIFNEVGLYSVKLFVSNGANSDILLKESVITVGSSVKPKYVSLKGDDAGSGTISSPFRTIQKAIDVSLSNIDTIIVENGKYIENISFKGKNVVVSSKYLFTKNPSDILNTIIDGKKSGSVVVFKRGENRNAQLIGFTIQNGSGDFVQPNWVAGESKKYIGGGIMCDNNSSPSLRFLIIKNNSAEFMGSAIYAAQNSNIHLSNSIIFQNKGPNTIFLHSSDISIDSTYIINNNGGGIYTATDTKSNINRCIIARNEDIYSNIGSAIHYDVGSKGILTNSIVINNKDNHNMASNSISPFCGIFLHVSDVYVCNSIIYNNYPYNISFSNGRICGPSSIVLTHTDLTGGQNAIFTNNNGTNNWLESNKDYSPAFIDTSKYDFRIHDYCTSIDAGINFFVYNQDTIVNIPRLSYNGINPDIGVFESLSAKTTVETLVPIVLGISAGIENVQNRINESYGGSYCYPNPFNPDYQNIVINYMPVGSEPYTIRIFDLSGRVLKIIESNHLFTSGENVFYLDGTNIYNKKVNSGIYFYEIKSSRGSRLTGKILVTH